MDDPGMRAALRSPTAWLFGNEAWGLPGDLLALADESVAVPIYGRAESLNLAAAAAVCLYASAQSQRAGKHGLHGTGILLAGCGKHGRVSGRLTCHNRLREAL